MRWKAEYKGPGQQADRGQAATLILRRMRAHGRIEGWEDPDGWSESDYVVIDGATAVGRIYRDTIHGEPKWRWFLQTVPPTRPIRGWPIPSTTRKPPSRNATCSSESDCRAKAVENKRGDPKAAP